MNAILNWVVGKNLPSFARAIATLVGSLLLASVLFSGEAEPLSGELIGAAEHLDAPVRVEIEDGITVGELLKSLLGMGLIYAARLQSFLRAKNLTGLAKVFGVLVGRSLPSLFRAALTALAGGLAWLSGGPADAPEVLADKPVASAIGAVLAFIAARFFSAKEDGERNPVASPRPQQLPRSFGCGECD